VDSGSGSNAVAVAAYTLLRVGLFAVVWLVIELLTPINGVWAIVAAILMSGAISLIVLDRQRAAVGQAAAGFFGRINARIEASARAEDDDAPGVAGLDDSGKGKGEPDRDSVGEQ
jgi:hypothetical protein